MERLAFFLLENSLSQLNGRHFVFDERVLKILLRVSGILTKKLEKRTWNHQINFLKWHKLCHIFLNCAGFEQISSIVRNCAGRTSLCGPATVQDTGIPGHGFKSYKFGLLTLSVNVGSSFAMLSMIKIIYLLAVVSFLWLGWKPSCFYPPSPWIEPINSEDHCVNTGNTAYFCKDR